MRISSRHGLMRTSAVLGLLMAGLAAQPSLAQTRTTYDFDIPREPLSKALRDYATLTHQQLMFTEDLTAGKMAPAIKGLLQHETALERILLGSGLTAKRTPVGALVIQLAPSPVSSTVVQPGSPNSPAAAPSNTPGAIVLAQLDPNAPTAAKPPAEQPVAPGTLTITGSRIVRNGYSTPTPVTVATAEQLQATTPSDIPDGLNKLPDFAGSSSGAGSNNTPGGRGGGRQFVNGGAFLSLRDLGPVRTLILLDGRRVAPTALSGQVDVNTLPEMLVQRVDIVTGGASAVYGSDAVVGVVNFVLDKSFTGLKVFAQGGESTYGDAQSYRFGVAGGAELFDRLHVEGSFEQYQANGVKHNTDRPWAADIPAYVGRGTAASPFTLLTNVHINNAALGGLATSGPFSGQQFVGSGTLAPFDKGAPTLTASDSIGGDGANFSDVELAPPFHTVQAFGRFDYDLTSNVKAYVQVSDSEGKLWNSHSNAAPGIATTIFSGNPYLPASAQAQLTGTGTLANPQFSNFTLSRVSTDLWNQQVVDQLTDDLMVTAGVTGKTFGDFTWDAYYTHGSATVKNTIKNDIYWPNFYAALDAVTGPNGQPVCRVSTTAYASLYPGCQPINLFGVGNESAAAKAFVYQNTGFRAVTTMDDAAVSLSGDAFNDWAGPVSVAFNAEYRSQSLNETANPSTNQLVPTINYGPLGPVSYVGLTPEASGGSIQSTAWAGPSQTAQHGANSVWEVSGETVVPLLKDMVLVKALDVSGAVRYTDYSSSGAAVTWKVGFNYQPVEDLRFRFTASRDIRAPSLFDLYAASSAAQVALSDPHTGVAKTVTQLLGGNPNLTPEVSYTTTGGFVYSPSWLPRFRMSVDYYNINVTNLIAAVSGIATQVLAQCEASGGTSPVCSSIVRPLPFSNTTAANFPTYVTNYSTNIAQAYTHGIDTEASYNFMLGDVIRNAPGRFDLRVLYAYQPVLNTLAYPGATPTTYAGASGMSANRITSNLGYSFGPVSLDWQLRWLSSQNRSQSALTIYAGPPLPAIFYHDINVTYRFKAAGHDSQLYLVVENLLNQAPRISPSSSSGANPGSNSPSVWGDDQIGRYFTLGFRAQY